MLSKNDYADYLDQIYGIENTMRELYESCAEISEDKNIHDICLALARQEKEHARLVDELKKIFNVTRAI